MSDRPQKLCPVCDGTRKDPMPCYPGEPCDECGGTGEVDRPASVAVEIRNKAGTVMLTIDRDGRLAKGGQFVTEPGYRHGLFEAGTRTALDGSRVTAFETWWDVTLRRFTKDGREWWAADGTLCNLKDIDRARVVKATIAVKGGEPSWPWAEYLAGATNTEGRA